MHLSQFLIIPIFNLVEMAGGINNFSPMLGNNASHLMKNLQQLISSNPEYLTSGIPTHLIQQMWNAKESATTANAAAGGSLSNNNVMLQSKVMMQKKIIDVCLLFYYYLTFSSWKNMGDDAIQHFCEL